MKQNQGHLLVCTLRPAVEVIVDGLRPDGCPPLQGPEQARAWPTLPAAEADTLAGRMLFCPSFAGGFVHFPDLIRSAITTVWSGGLMRKTRRPRIEVHYAD